MKALIYRGPRKVVVEDVPRPEIHDGEVLVKVQASGICGSDIHGFTGETGRRWEGFIMGHECCGTVAETGKNAANWKTGERVIVQPSLFCDNCEYCLEGRTHLCRAKRFLGVFDLHGAMAEYVVVPAKQLFSMPGELTAMDGALIEPLAVAMCAVEKIPFDLQGKKTLVVGAGMIGLLVISVLRSRGAEMIVASDLSDKRLAIAKAVGADCVVNPMTEDIMAKINQYTGGCGMDVSFEAVGSDIPVKNAIDSLRLGGHCVWVGNYKKEIVIDMQSVVTREITIHGTYTYSQEDFGRAIRELPAMGIQTDQLVNRLVSIEEAPEILEYLAAGNDDLVKVQIVFP